MEAPWLRFYEEGVPAHIEYPDISLPDLLDRTVETYPEKIALRFFVDVKLPSSTLSYRGLQEQTLRFATAGS